MLPGSIVPYRGPTAVSAGWLYFLKDALQNCYVLPLAIHPANFTLGSDSPFRNLRLYGAADNLITLTDYEGFDPEASAVGSGNVSRVAYNSYPLARTYRFGVDVTF